MKTKLPIADCRLPVEKPEGSRRLFQIVNGFTLIELLAVIFIIAILAAFTVPVLHSLSKLKYLNTAKAEMGQLETAIDSYHAAYGFYPPDNGNTANYLPSALTNQLYYELEGTYTNAAGNYVTLDGASQIPMTSVSTAFGAGGFVNSGATNSNNSGEDVRVAQNFIHELTPRQTATLSANSVNVTLLVSSVGGPDPNYNPLGAPANTSNPAWLYPNPWRYKSSGTLTNNPGSYELWIQLQISGKKYLVCNWSKTVQINSPLP
jgi:type IV pilus assembly protein PilE